MKTRTNLCLSLLFALILTGCNKPNPSSNDSLPSDEEASITSEIPPTSEDITSKEEPVTNDGTSSTSEGKDIKSEVLSFLSNTASHGNTNGNANNNGLAVYDHSLTFHYYAVKDRVYKHDPKTNMTYFLFASGDGSYIKHLSLGDSTLYYVTTANNYTYKHDLLANVSSLIYNEETLSIHRYYDNVFLQSNKLYYEVMTTGLGVYDHRTQSLTSKFQPGTNNVNLGWGVNYRVLKNTLCYIHPEKEALFIAFQMREVDIIKIKDSLSPYALKVWENRYPCGHGGWMWYHLTSLDQVEEVHLLLNTKIKPNK
ncbi:MAG: DUF3788 family protein [Bacilli bacterium]|nr:DUF3788 family protein [Bacilli bacterium]